MTSVEGESANRWAGERVITSFIAASGQKNSINSFISKLPWFIGGPIYFAAYVARGVNIFGFIHYTLTNRRIRVERGIVHKLIESVSLEEVRDIRIEDEIKFTRTGDLVIVGDGDRVLLRLVGVQDPWPARQTILDAVQSRVQIQRVMERERRVREAAVAAHS